MPLNNHWVKEEVKREMRIFSIEWKRKYNTSQRGLQLKPCSASRESICTGKKDPETERNRENRGNRKRALWEAQWDWQARPIRSRQGKHTNGHSHGWGKWHHHRPCRKERKGVVSVPDANVLDNLEEKDKFLKRRKLSKPIQEEIENVNSSIAIKDRMFS